MTSINLFLSMLLLALSFSFYFYLRHVNKFMKKMVDALKESTGQQEKVTHIIQAQFDVIQQASKIIMAGNATKEDLMQFKSLLEEMQKACDMDSQKK